MRTHAWQLVAGLLVSLVSSDSIVAKGTAEEVWQLQFGQKIDGRLVDVFGPMVFIVGPKTVALVPIDRFAADSVDRIGDFLIARDRAPAATWANSDSPVIRCLRGRVQVLADDKLVNFEPGETTEPAFFLVYFSAHWCGPCRRYTPGLVEAYKRLKQQRPGLFELVFVSSDESAGDQAKYVREAGMPWLVAKYSNLGSLRPITRFAADGIPNLVLLSRDGDLIAHSYDGKEYLGPDSVWQRFEKLVTGMDPENSATQRMMHPLEVRRHVTAAGGGSCLPKPYLITTDRPRKPGAAATMITVVAEVDASGRVTAATTEPPLSAVDAYEFSREAQNWLFLPAVADGQARAASVRFVLKH